MAVAAALEDLELAQLSQYLAVNLLQLRLVPEGLAQQPQSGVVTEPTLRLALLLQMEVVVAAGIILPLRDSPVVLAVAGLVIPAQLLPAALETRPQHRHLKETMEELVLEQQRQIMAVEVVEERQPQE